MRGFSAERANNDISISAILSQRAFWIRLAFVGCKHIFHCCYERGVFLWRDAPALLLPWFKVVF